jgi:type I restriction enzyme S subunit
VVIIEAVERRLSLLDQTERELDALERKAQAQRQAILKAAFSGQLVAQDPNDEPASVLLERIRAERARREEERKTSRRKPMAIKSKPPRKERIPLIQALQETKDWLSSSDLLAAAGYPADADANAMETFYLELKRELTAPSPRIERERRGDQDYFRVV